jgi:EpsD family peptidyl-prolyl cis-trans isomerase
LLHRSELNRGRLRAVATILAVVAGLALVGCGKKQDAEAVVGQVIAHVGPDDVTKQELDNELSLARVPVDKRSDEVVKAALTQIVERKYLVQQAIASKLDREPTIHLDLLRAREGVLASAFSQRDLGTKISTISKSEEDSYIQAHPTQFANRQIFQIEQISFPPQKNMDEITAATKDYKSLDQVSAKLNELGIKFNRGTGTLDSATLPAELVKPLEGRKPDDIFFIRSRTAATFFKVISQDAKPLTGDDADAYAKRLMTSDLARKNNQDTVAAGLAATKYEGDYSRIMSIASPTSAPTANEAPVPAEPPAAATDAPK